MCKTEKANTQWSTMKVFNEWRRFPLSYHDESDKDHQQALENQAKRPLQRIETAAAVVQEKICEGTVRLMKNVLFAVQKNISLSLTTDIHNLILHHGNDLGMPSILPNSHKYRKNRHITIFYIINMDEIFIGPIFLRINFLKQLMILSSKLM